MKATETGLINIVNEVWNEKPNNYNMKLYHATTPRKAKKIQAIWGNKITGKRIYNIKGSNGLGIKSRQDSNL